MRHERVDPLLERVSTTKIFGGLVAVSDVSIDVAPKSIVSIIGPNGAGKTTFFNMLTGLYRPTAGRILFDGRDVTGTRPDSITAAGVARTFQNIRLFATMSALENVMVGHALAHEGRAVRVDPAHAERAPRGAARSREKAREMLTYVGLSKRPPRADRREPVLRRPAARGDRPRARLRAEAAAARRADGRHEPAGVRRS